MCNTCFPRLRSQQQETGSKNRPRRLLRFVYVGAFGLQQRERLIVCLFWDASVVEQKIGLQTMKTECGLIDFCALASLAYTLLAAGNRLQETLPTLV